MKLNKVDWPTRHLHPHQGRALTTLAYNACTISDNIFVILGLTYARPWMLSSLASHTFIFTALGWSCLSQACLEATNRGFI